MPFDRDGYHQLRSSTHVGAEVVYEETVTSTMDAARAGAAARRPCGTAYVAGEQTAGRGRLGRTWISAAATGLYVTYHLCPPDAARAPLLSIAGGLAAADAIRDITGLDVDLKWPNDLLHEGRKLCGILAEAEHPANQMNVYLGFGINLRSNPDMPPDVAQIATSIEATGATPPSPESLLAALSGCLEHYEQLAADDPEELVATWRDRLITIGQHVRVAAPDGTFEGRAVDVSPSGELIIDLGDFRRAFSAGDVTVVRR